MELIDVVDENNKLTGIVLDRKAIHEKGLWHRQVSCWIMNKEGKLLFQKRAVTKNKNPNKWALTAGHVSSGESTLIGVKREVKEEIGVNISEEKFELLFIDINNRKNYKENVPHCYFGYNYFTVVNYMISDYTIQKEELQDLQYLSIEEIERLKKEENPNYTFINWGEYYDKIIEILKQKRKMIFEMEVDQ